ncbi:hypothetical protein GHT09_018066 [Marmota monax]|uniref:Uncharacterized protein n=1 Tax=Marmota monax TaxID=9995 RepID=A0A834UST6_MARMO|nr:hypothetical protein GHT09_018066 [Marmota monax]
MTITTIATVNSTINSSAISTITTNSTTINSTITNIIIIVNSTITSAITDINNVITSTIVITTIDSTTSSTLAAASPLLSPTWLAPPSLAHNHHNHQNCYGLDLEEEARFPGHQESGSI